MKKILIIGATSAIAEAVARVYAEQGDTLHLVARHAGRLKTMREDLRVRGAVDVTTSELDVCDADAYERVLDEAASSLKKIDIALIAHGTLPDQAQCESHLVTAMAEFQVNGTSVIALATLLAARMEAQGSGTLAVISSVAGDRGRQSNYLYGSAKAAVSAFLSGLGQRLAKKGIAVITIKPGFVDTPMTAAFPKGFLWSTPKRVARDITRGIDRRSAVIYTPGFWRLIMFVIRAIPETIFRKISL